MVKEGGGSRHVDLRELAKAGQSLQDLEGVLMDSDMGGLSVVDRERAYVETVATFVRRAASDTLGRGLKGLNQAEVGGALQV
ncbi:unnamed protein product, partial [Choristocarpus tenellus]